MQRNALGTVLGLMVCLIVFSGNVTAEPFWLRSVDDAGMMAAQSGKMIVVSVGAEWCHYCKKMDRETWPDRRVQQVLRKNYLPLKLNDQQHSEYLAMLKVTAFPTTLIFTPDRKFLTKVEGFLSPDKMAKLLEQARLAAQVSNASQISVR